MAKLKLEIRKQTAFKHALLQTIIGWFICSFHVWCFTWTSHLYYCMGSSGICDCNHRGTILSIWSYPNDIFKLHTSFITVKEHQFVLYKYFTLIYLRVHFDSLIASCSPCKYMPVFRSCYNKYWNKLTDADKMCKKGLETPRW